MAFIVAAVVGRFVPILAAAQGDWVFQASARRWQRPSRDLLPAPFAVSSHHLSIKWCGQLLWDQLHQDPLGSIAAFPLRPSLAFVGVGPGCGPRIVH